jgi:3-oxoadipate enol-lactonase
MATIEIDDTTIHYERSGHGPAMLFVHGMCGDAAVFADQARRFADRFTCVRFDRRGHSRSGRGSAAISIARHADDTAGVIAALDLAPCLVVASSAGAVVALDVALRHGHLVRAVALSEPPLFSLDSVAGQAFIGALMPRLERALDSGGPSAAVDAFFEFVCPRLWSMIDDAAKDRYRANADIGLTDLRSPSLVVSTSDLAALAVPSLVVTGDTSHPALRSVARRLATAVPDARLVEIADCGHVTYAEQPEAFARAVATFATELERRHPHSAEGGPSMGTKPETALETNRFDVNTADGASIAVWVDGEGPALVMVHGSIADHTTFEPFVAVLRQGLTTFSMDRRGFGATRDTPGYTIEQDFDDVAAVVDAVAARTGGPVAVWGHSYGANCAMGAAARSDNVDHLVLYEPSLGVPYPPGSIERIEAALSRGDHDAAIVAVLVDVLELTDEQIDVYRASPLWPVRLAAAPTIPRECRAEEAWVYQPGRFDTITAPTLLLSGSESVPVVKEATDQAAAAIPDSRIRVLAGHGHFAHHNDPAMVAEIVGQFISS